jgi:hypothetical protein
MGKTGNLASKLSSAVEDINPLAARSLSFVFPEASCCQFAYA